MIKYTVRNHKMGAVWLKKWVVSSRAKKPEFFGKFLESFTQDTCVEGWESVFFCKMCCVLLEIFSEYTKHSISLPPSDEWKWVILAYLQQMAENKMCFEIQVNIMPPSVYSVLSWKILEFFGQLRFFSVLKKPDLIPDKPQRPCCICLNDSINFCKCHLSDTALWTWRTK